MTTLYIAGPTGHSLKLLIAIAEKGLALDVRTVDALDLEQHRDPLSQFTPTGSLPVLVDGDFVLTESSIINEYLDETGEGPALMPESPRDRWRARTWFKFVNEDLAPAVSLVAWREWGLPTLSAAKCEQLREAAEAINALERRVHWQQALDGFLPAQQETADTKIAAFLDLAEQKLAEADYLAGTHFSLADVDAWPFLEPLRRLRAELIDARPRTRAWIERVLARPAVAAAYSGYADRLWVPGPELIRWG